jgi:hypothetical protein
MNATAFFTATIRSMFDRTDDTACALAASLACELRALPELPTWVESLSSLPSSERSASLLNAARNFRGEWATLGAADALKRIATKPALFRAVARELHAA